MGTGSLLCIAGTTGDDRAPDACLLKQVLIGIGIAVAYGGICFAAAVSDEGAVSRMGQILVQSGGRFLVIGDQIDQFVVDRESYVRGAVAKIDVSEKFVSCTVEGFHLLVFIRKRIRELNGDTVVSFVHDQTPVAVLEGTAAHGEPEELRMVE